MKVKAYIHSLKGQEHDRHVLGEAKIIKRIKDNEYLAEYRGIRCTAIFNPFAGAFFVDDVYGIQAKGEAGQMDMRAREIAAEHIRAKNPSLWDGKGKRPPDFNCGIAVYPLDEYTALNISFELEKDGWTHCCQLQNRETGKLLNVLHGYGVDSPQNLTDTIIDIASGHLKGGL